MKTTLLRLPKPSIAIVGGGLSGLVLADACRAFAQVTVFERRRQCGGRLSSAPLGDDATPPTVDAGAQFFTAKSSAFRSWLMPLEARGVVSRWRCTFAQVVDGVVVRRTQWGDGEAALPHYVGTPSMGALSTALAADLEGCTGVAIRRGVAVGEVTALPASRRWVVGGDVFDCVVAATPPAVATQLLPAAFEHAEAVRATRMLGCFNVAFEFAAPLPRSVMPFDVCVAKGHDISLVCANASKPGRSKVPVLVVHATNRWSDAHMGADAGFVRDAMFAELAAVFGQPLPPPVSSRVHRHEEANYRPREHVSEAAALFDADMRLGACGDWAAGKGVVEAAFTSATALAALVRCKLVGGKQ